MNLPNDISSCHELLKTQSVQIEELQTLVEHLNLEMSELKERLNKNSQNSNKPPSSDGLSKPSPKPAFKKPEKPLGGQKGHKGKTLELTSSPDEVLELKPQSCTCGHCLGDSDLSLLERRQVFDLPQPQLFVTEYQRYGGVCPSCGDKVSSQFPSSVPSRVQYGSGVRALSVLLHTDYCLSASKINTLFSDLFDYGLNEGSVMNYQRTCDLALIPSEKTIIERIHEQKVVHSDETGLRVEGKLHWLHVACSDLYTYFFVHAKRGKDATESEFSLLPTLNGWVVHDCWSSYFRLDGCKHAICGAHILRELQALIEGGSIWASWFHCYLLAVLNLTKLNTNQVLTPEQQKKAISLFDKIWGNADQLEPVAEKKKGQRGRPKATKGRNLLNRLGKHKDAVIAFALHSEVPFTNNLAERALRPAKTKQKVAGCFRTTQGADRYARIEGFIATSRKHLKNTFSELKKAFNGYTFLTSKMKC